MIKNYIFDFGNVLAEFYPDKLTAPFVKDEETNKRIREVAFDRLYWDKLDSGDITDEEVKNAIRSRLSEEDSKIACLVYDNWVKSMTPVKDMGKLVKDILTFPAFADAEIMSIFAKVKYPYNINLAGMERAKELLARDVKAEIELLISERERVAEALKAMP